jgi:hypothetical protein
MYSGSRTYVEEVDLPELRVTHNGETSVFPEHR